MKIDNGNYEERASMFDLATDTRWGETSDIQEMISRSYSVFDAKED